MIRSPMCEFYIAIALTVLGLVFLWIARYYEIPQLHLPAAIGLLSGLYGMAIFGTMLSVSRGDRHDK